jgi:hypothetical protein
MGAPPAPPPPKAAFKAQRKKGGRGWSCKPKSHAAAAPAPLFCSSYAVGTALTSYAPLPPQQPRPTVGDTCLVRWKTLRIPAATIWTRGTVVSLNSSFQGSLTFSTEAETHLIHGAEHVFPTEATWSCEDSCAAIVIVQRATTTNSAEGADEAAEEAEEEAQAVAGAGSELAEVALATGTWPSDRPAPPRDAKAHYLWMVGRDEGTQTAQGQWVAA